MTKAKVTCVLGARIELRLEALDQNQSWLAERMSVSAEAVSKWKRGGGIEFVKLQSLARHLKCSIGYLCGDNPDSYIAEVSRVMEELTDDGRKSIRDGAVMMAATLPKRIDNKKHA